MNKCWIAVVLFTLVGCSVRPLQQSDLTHSQREREFRLRHDVEYLDEQTRGTEHERQLHDHMGGESSRWKGVVFE